MNPKYLKGDSTEPTDTTHSSVTSNAGQTPLLGIDVSAYQGEIDWNMVARSGVKFVFIKATEGGNFVDHAFQKNIRGARSAKLPCAAYHFFRPKIPVKQQVDNFVRTVKPFEPGDLQAVLDLESANDWRHIRLAKRIEMIEEWATLVKDSLACETTLYMSASFAQDVLGNSKRLSKYALWVAHYTEATEPSVPAPWLTWSFWQYSNKGKIAGIKGAVDCDLFNGTREQLDKFRR